MCPRQVRTLASCGKDGDDNYWMPALLDLSVLIFLVHRSCMLAPSLHNMLHDFRLIGKIENRKGFNTKNNY